MKRTAACVLLLVPALLLGSCGWIDDATDDLTTRSANEDVPLDTFNLSNPAVGRVAGLAAGPWEECGITNVNALITDAGVDPGLVQQIDLQTVKYTVLASNANDPITVSLAVGDPGAPSLDLVATATVPAGPSDVGVYTELIFEEPNGRSIVQSGLDTPAEDFEYCLTASQDTTGWSISVEVVMGLRVTVGI